MLRSTILLAAVAVALTLCGCRQGQSRPSDKDETSETERSSSAESADALADRARTAMARRQFADTGKLFAQAYTAPAGDDSTISDDQRFDWRCRAVLAIWLARGDCSQAWKDIIGLGLAAEPAQGVKNKSLAQWRDDYIIALMGAMRVYQDGGWPRTDPDQMVAVLDIAAAIQAEDIERDSIAGSIADSQLATDWATLAALPRVLSAWSALDEGGLNLADYQLVARMRMDPPDEATGATTRPAAWNPPDSICSDSACWGSALHAVPSPADQPQPTSGWIAWFGSNQAGWQDLPWTGRLVIGVRRHPRVVASVQAAIEWRAGKAAPRHLQLRDQAEARRLAAGLKVINSAMPDGATPLATRQQAEMVVAALDRLTATSGRARIQPQDNFFWVRPAAQGQAGELIPLVAGWLASRQWQAAADLPAASQPVDALEPEVIDPPEP